MTQEDSQFRLRIPADLKARVEDAAKAAGRSINAQVLYYVELALGQEGAIEELRGRAEEHEAWLLEIDKRLKRLDRNIDIVAERVGIET